MADEFRRELDKFGPGGVKCQCCNPFFGKERKKLRRLARARLKMKHNQRIKNYKE